MTYGIVLPSYKDVELSFFLILHSCIYTLFADTKLLIVRKTKKSILPIRNSDIYEFGLPEPYVPDISTNRADLSYKKNNSRHKLQEVGRIWQSCIVILSLVSVIVHDHNSTCF